MQWVFSWVVGIAALLGLALLALIVRAQGLGYSPRKLIVKLWHASVAVVRSLATARERSKPIFEAGAETLRSLANRSEADYAVPWLVAIGQPGSGKTALLDALSESHACHAPLQQQLEQSLQGKSSGGSHSNWHFLRSGVVIDLDAPGTGGGWRRTLRQLDEKRPERPVDGIVVTVSAALLVSGDLKEQRRVATRLFKQLWALQQHLEFSLPVYWVVTQVDAVPGFREFWASLEVPSEQVFGWSSPARLDAQFDAGWVAQAFACLLPRLRELQLRAFAKGTFRQEAPQESRRGAAVERMLLFPQKFEKLQAALTQFASVAFAQTVHQAGVTVRGLYFTGTLQSEEAPALVGELFAKKILVERHLAAPLRPRLWSRSHVLRRLQRGVLSAAGVLGLALTASAAHVAWRVDHQVQAVRAAAAANPTFDPQCPKRSLIEAVFADAALTEDTTNYWALPGAWLDSRSRLMRTQFVRTRVFKNVLFPALRCQLRKQASELAKAPAAEDHISPLVRLAAITRWEEQRSVFASLAQKSNMRQRPEALANLIHLVEETLGFKPGPALIPGNRISLQALRSLHYSLPVVENLSEHRQAFTAALEEQAKYYRGYLRSEALAGADACQLLGYASPRLSGALRTLAQWREGPGTLWARSSATHNPCNQLQRALGAAVHDLQVSQPAYSQAALSTSVELFAPAVCETPIEKKLALVRGTACGDLLGLDSATGATATIPLTKKGMMKASEAALDTLAAGATQKILALAGLQGGATKTPSAITRALDQLAGAPFLQGETPKAFVCKAPAAWHFERVTGALAAITSYQRALTPLGSSGEELMIGVRERLRLAVGGALHTAQIGAKQVSGPVQASQSFARSLPALLQILARVSQLGFEPSQLAWGSCLQQFAVNGLLEVGQAWGEPFALEAAGLPTLSGPLPVRARTLYLGFAHKSQAARRFQIGLSRVDQLSRRAAPYVQWLRAAGWFGQLPIATRPLLARMSATLDVLEAHGASKQSAASDFEEFLTKTLVGISNDNCDKRLLAQPDSAGSDEFSAAQRRLYEQALGLCWHQGRITWLWHYRRIRRAFENRLQGKYPFGSLRSPDAAPQDVAAVAKLLAEPALAQASSADYTQQDLGAQEKFVNDLRQAVTQLQPYLDGQQAVGVTIAFRPSPPLTRGAEDILRRVLHSGAKRAVFPNGSTELEWKMGESFTLELQWANRSLFRPRSDPTQTDLRVAGVIARFGQAGNWALQRWLQIHADPSHLNALGTVGVIMTIPLQNVEHTNNWGNADVSMELRLKAADGSQFKLDIFPQFAPPEPSLNPTSLTLGELR